MHFIFKLQQSVLPFVVSSIFIYQSGYGGIGVAKFGIDMLQKLPGFEPDPKKKKIQDEVFADVGGGVGASAAAGALIGAFFGPIGAGIGAAVGRAYGGGGGGSKNATRK